jgi:hypothetical protein
LNATETSSSQPALWNPAAAASWSVLFSPAFGAYLHSRNAERLGRAQEAKANRIWFYGSLTFLALVLVDNFFPAIPVGVFEYGSIGLLFGWYFSLGKRQTDFVKTNLQNHYQRNPWTKPISIAFGCWIGFAVAVTAFDVAAEWIGNIQETVIPDVTKPTQLTLSPRPNQKGIVQGLTLRIQGNLDGAAQILVSQELRPTNNVSGSFKIEYGGDYYDSNCIINFIPASVKGGNVTVQYRFNCF